RFRDPGPPGPDPPLAGGRCAADPLRVELSRPLVLRPYAPATARVPERPGVQLPLSRPPRPADPRSAHGRARPVPRRVPRLQTAPAGPERLASGPAPVRRALGADDRLQLRRAGRAPPDLYGSGLEPGAAPAPGPPAHSPAPPGTSTGRSGRGTQ